MAENSKPLDSSRELPDASHCNVCGSSALEEVTAYRSFRRVASDARSWPSGGKIDLCQFCGAIQKVPDQTFLREIGEIYSTYAVYHQSKGEEQAVFRQDASAVTSRSRRMLEQLRTSVPLAHTGRMLDIGCGNGVMLRAFHEAAPQWTLAGAELNDRFRAVVEAIPNCEKLYNCPPQDIPGQFDLITMVHSLEHIVGPVDFLTKVKTKLAPGGLLMIEVPNVCTNPFEVIVADHTSHFTGSSLQALVKQAGYEILYFSDTWIAKELTLIARPSDAAISAVPASPEQVAISTQTMASNMRWLAETVASAKHLAAQGPLGLFGTSIASTWLSAELEGTASYFVDEDMSRPGNLFQGRSIYSPEQLPQGSRVFIGLPPNIANMIRDRLQQPGIEYFAPPAKA